mmetsp:Transcript_10799/g.15952  ORF Transcript_10799/g.15952 Transcript_10799/m.15952 type:complete len:105 (+) Transcript_10799:412-726(+)
MLHVRLSTICIFVSSSSSMLHFHLPDYRVFTDTFPESTEYVSAWPTRRATASNSTTTRPTTCLSVEEPVTPTDDDFEENYPQDKPTRQLSTILSGDALSGDDEV